MAALSPATDSSILLAEPERGGFGSDEFRYMFGSREEYENSPWNIGKAYSEADKDRIPELFIGCGDHDIAVDTQVKNFNKTLDTAEIPYKYFEISGNHDYDTWEAMLDPVFSFLAGVEVGKCNSLSIDRH